MTSFGFGGSNLETGGPNTNGEFSYMIMEILHGAMEALFRKSREKLKNQCEMKVPDPTNPFGNPLGFGLSL